MVRSKKRKSKGTSAEGLRGNCKGCAYSLGTTYNGYCDYCWEEFESARSHYGRDDERNYNKYSVSDSVWDEVTDGTSIAVFGHSYIRILSPLYVPTPGSRPKPRPQYSPIPVAERYVPMSVIEGLRILEERTVFLKAEQEARARAAQIRRDRYREEEEEAKRREELERYKRKERIRNPILGYHSTLAPRKGFELTPEYRTEAPAIYYGTTVPALFVLMVRAGVLGNVPIRASDIVPAFQWGARTNSLSVREFRVLIGRDLCVNEEAHVGGRFVVQQVSCDRELTYGDIFVTSSLQDLWSYITETNSEFPTLEDNPTKQQVVYYIEALVDGNYMPPKEGQYGLPCLADKDVILRKYGERFLQEQIYRITT